MMRFTLPRDIYYGRGSLEQLSKIKGKKAVLVLGGGSMRKFGFLDRALEYLSKANIEVKLIEGVEPDPSVETVLRGAETMIDFDPDLIIAMGGGSPIDAAKAMWVFYEHPELTFEDTKVPFTMPDLRTKARFIAIPSTSGTASEITSFSIITDYKTQVKYPIVDFNITPDIAIVDPDLAETMPARLTAYTGMDALTHAVEAYVSTLHSPFTDPVAMKAIEMIKKDLVKSYECDMEAREEIHYAQCLAGMAFSNASLGISHSMAHKTGAVFHIAHGCANAIYLPYVIEFNKVKSLDRYAEIANRLNLEGENNEELVASLVKMVKELNSSMGIPQSLKEYGIDETEFNSKLDLISERAIGDACTGSNPREIDKEQMKKLFKCIYYGTEVDF